MGLGTRYAYFWLLEKRQDRVMRRFLGHEVQQKVGQATAQPSANKVGRGLLLCYNQGSTGSLLDSAM